MYESDRDLSSIIAHWGETSAAVSTLHSDLCVSVTPPVVFIQTMPVMTFHIRDNLGSFVIVEPEKAQIRHASASLYVKAKLPMASVSYTNSKRRSEWLGDNQKAN